jgi:inhibitor of KinA sporulation pathway (predicted exonuclease)
MEYYLCVLDFEATCWENSKNKNQMEIIEWPSVLYKVTENENGLKGTTQLIGEFHQYVKPTINFTLTAFCTQLTGITQNVVNNAGTFEIVYKNHIKWLSENVPQNSNFIITTCGKWDLEIQLVKELYAKNFNLHGYYKKFIDVKTEFETQYKMKAYGMKGMLRDLNLKLDGRHHSGIDDTRNISKIMLQIINDGRKFNDFTFYNVVEKSKNKLK